MASENSFNTGLGNGLLPDGGKPLLIPMLLSSSINFRVIFIWILKISIPNLCVFKMYTFEIITTSPGEQRVNSLVNTGCRENKTINFATKQSLWWPCHFDGLAAWWFLDEKSGTKHHKTKQNENKTKKRMSQRIRLWNMTVQIPCTIRLFDRKIYWKNSLRIRVR